LNFEAGEPKKTKQNKVLALVLALGASQSNLSQSQRFVCFVSFQNLETFFI
jgi:hypothetical protein